MTTVAFQGQGGGLDSNLGWKGAEIIATVPQVFDLWADPQERYDIFMNNFTESTWMGPLRRYAVLSHEIQSLHQEACLIGACSEATAVRDSSRRCRKVG